MSLKLGGASYELRVVPDVLSTDAYVTVCTWTIAGFKTRIMTFTAADEDLLVRTDYSDNVGLSWTEEVAEFSVTTAAAVAKSSTTVRGQVRIQVKSAAPSTPGTLSIRLFGTSLS